MTSQFVILGVSGLFCRFYSIFLWEIPLANTLDPDQTPHNIRRPHYVVFDLGLQSLPRPFYGFPGKNGLNIVDSGRLGNADTNQCLQHLH